MRKHVLLASAATLAMAGAASAQTTFGPGPGGPIPDSLAAGVPGVLTTSITVPAGSPAIASFNNVSLTMGTGVGPTGGHTWVGDIVVQITAPNGDNSQVMVRTGSTTPTGFGDTSDFAGGPYTFAAAGADFTAAALAEGTGTAPVPPGTYARFNNPLVAPNPPTDADTYSVFAGDPSAGVWTLSVQDWAGGDTGGLASWTMNMTFVPEPGSLGLLAGGALLPLLRRRRA
jgi:hypothetical protein